MTDRSVIRDQAEHARRTNPQTDGARLAEIRDQIRLALHRADGFTDGLAALEPHGYQDAADAIITAVVQPLLADRAYREAELADWRAENRQLREQAAKAARLIDKSRTGEAVVLLRFMGRETATEVRDA